MRQSTVQGSGVASRLATAHSSCRVPRALHGRREFGARLGPGSTPRGVKWCCASESQEAVPETTGEGIVAEEPVDVPRSDDVLPDNLPDAIRQASEATAKALAAGAQKCTVEILLPEFWDPTSGPMFKEEGDQQRFWNLTRRFINNLVTETGYSKIRAIYPDMGVTAMLSNQWKKDGEIGFALGSLNDTVMVEAEDELVIVAAPDPPGLDSCLKLASQMSEGQALVMFNPRLASGEVGVGMNIRRMRQTFLNTFLITYSLCPIGDIGSVFRRYPGAWQVFVEDSTTQGRYKLAAERDSRPSGEGLDYIITKALRTGTGEDDDSEVELGFLDQVSSTMASFQRFMRSLSQ
ncbi:hypothetical protein BSKO_06297 [Bryopsis sp. KO-2023]|nr:hypothetical protein BSKO_06297 [Bryopsis sp. KO-2023]